jgi:hypothetical protein
MADEILKKVPLWVIANVLEPRGRKFSFKRPVAKAEMKRFGAYSPSGNSMTAFPFGPMTPFEPKCAFCGDPALVEATRSYRDHKYYHENCYILMKKHPGSIVTVSKDFKPNSDWYAEQLEEEEEEIITSAERIDGNLSTGEYRWWIGSRMKTSSFAMCRACRSIVSDPLQRMMHKESPKIEGMTCKIRLYHAYRFLLEQVRHRCVVCRGETRYVEFGVPMCMGCVNTWKFGKEELPTLQGAMIAAVLAKRGETIEGIQVN